MKKSLELLLVCICGFCLNIQGQTSVQNWRGLNETSNNLHGKLTGTIFYQPPTHNGSYYYNTEWLSGTIETLDGEIITCLKLMLNAYTDELLYFNPRIRTTIIVDKALIKRFSMINEWTDTLKFEPVFVDRYPKGDRYLRKLWQGNDSLYVWYQVIEISETPYKDHMGILRNTKLILQKHYYLLTGKSEMKRLGTNKRAFYSAYPEHKRTIRRLFRKNKLREFDEEWQMTKAFEIIEKAGIL